MTPTLSHNDKFSVRDIHWCGVHTISMDIYTIELVASDLQELGIHSKLENNSWKLVRHNGLVVFVVALDVQSGRLTIAHDPVATAFILALVDRAHKNFVASFDDGHAIKPMLIGPEDLVARHPGTGLVFATKLMLALKLIGGIKLGSNIKKSTNTQGVHNFCG